MSEERTELERVEELFAFLQGEVPEGCRISEEKVPHLTEDQAWAVIWWLGNQFWEVPDFIERCDVCGTLYDSEREGGTLDYGTHPYSFCDECMESDAWREKSAKNPDKN